MSLHSGGCGSAGSDDMKLLMAAASPFVRTVRVAIRETGQTDAIEEVPVVTTPVAHSPDLAAVNPLGKVPTLLREDGPALYDSRVICRFVDARAGAGLYPEARLWDVLTLEATAMGIMDAAVIMVYEKRVRPEETWSPDWLENQWLRVERALSVLNARWMSHLAGPLDMGQIALGCALGYLDFRHAERDWRGDHDALASWEAEFARRDSMRDTRPG